MIHKLFVYKLNYFNLSNPSIKKIMMSDSQWYEANSVITLVSSYAFVLIIS